MTVSVKHTIQINIESTTDLTAPFTPTPSPSTKYIVIQLPCISVRKAADLPPESANDMPLTASTAAHVDPGPSHVSGSESPAPQESLEVDDGSGGATLGNGSSEGWDACLTEEEKITWLHGNCGI
jgi:hypothetical protein